MGKLGLFSLTLLLPALAVAVSFAISPGRPALAGQPSATPTLIVVVEDCLDFNGECDPTTTTRTSTGTATRTTPTTTTRTASPSPETATPAPTETTTPQPTATSTPTPAGTSTTAPTPRPSNTPGAAPTATNTVVVAGATLTATATPLVQLSTATSTPVVRLSTATPIPTNTALVQLRAPNTVVPTPTANIVLGTAARREDVRSVPATGSGAPGSAPGAGEWLAIAAGTGAVFLLAGMRVAGRRAGSRRR